MIEEDYEEIQQDCQEDSVEISQEIVQPKKQVTPHSERSNGRPKGQKDKYPRKPRIRLDLRKKRAFLKSLEKHGSVTRAAADVNIARGTIYLNIDNDKEFARMVDEAKARAYSVIEEYAFKRLIDGETTTIKDADGNVVQTIHKPAAPALVNRMLEATENFAKKDSTVTHVHQVSDNSAVTKLAQMMFGLNLEDSDFNNKPNEIEIDGEVVDEEKGE